MHEAARRCTMFSMQLIVSHVVNKFPGLTQPRCSFCYSMATRDPLKIMFRHIHFNFKGLETAVVSCSASV